LVTRDRGLGKTSDDRDGCVVLVRTAPNPPRHSRTDARHMLIGPDSKQRNEFSFGSPIPPEPSVSSFVVSSPIFVEMVRTWSQRGKRKKFHFNTNSPIKGTNSFE
jgi:hypothetical protein